MLEINWIFLLIFFIDFRYVGTNHLGDILCIKNIAKDQAQAEAAPASFTMFWSAFVLRSKKTTIQSSASRSAFFVL